MNRPLSLVLLATLLGGCAGSGQNALLGDVLGRALQETSLSGADQGLAVKAVQVAAQGGNHHRGADSAGGAAPGGSEPAAEEAESW